MVMTLGGDGGGADPHRHRRAYGVHHQQKGDISGRESSTARDNAVEQLTNVATDSARSEGLGSSMPLVDPPTKLPHHSHELTEDRERRFTAEAAR